MALRPARLGVMRLGGTRLDVYEPWIKVFVKGVLLEGGGAITDPRARIDGMSITQVLNHELDTASFRVSGFIANKGDDVKIYMGDLDVAHQLFGGLILNVSQTYEPYS